MCVNVGKATVNNIVIVIVVFVVIDWSRIED